MAKLTASQKKSRSKFIALLVAIVLVCAAIAFILFDGITSKSTLFENQDFARGLATALDKLAINLDTNDVESAKYLELQYNSQASEYTLSIGYDDFDAEYEKQVAASENTEEATSEETEKKEEETVDLSTLVKTATFVSNTPVTASDLVKFTGVKTFSLGGITLSDVSFVENFTNLTRGYFNTCGIKDVTPFAKLNLDNIKELDFTGNEISDWTALKSIEDKVLVQNTYSIEMTEDGQYQLVPLRKTLKEYNEELAKADEEKTENAETAE